MDLFLKDLKILEEKSKENKNISKFIIEGLYPGYGVTIGNALRRILLSSIEGSAITSCKIKGIQHEFSTIPYVYQSVIDIILNLKELHVKNYSDEPQIIKLKAEGEREVYGRDFEPNPMVEIMNPDHLIATLTDKKASLEIEAVVENGIGYSLAEERKKGKTPIGTILLDAIFSPVERVNMQIEDMRVGEKTNYNRLILEIETDGSINPKRALLKALEILKSHITIIESSIKEEGEGELEAPSVFKETKKEPKDILVEELDLSSRTKNVLIKNGIKTLAGLLRYKEDSLKKLEGMGEKSFEEIKKLLKNLEYLIK